MEKQIAKKKILIVDDDADLRAALNIRLRANGYEVAFAADALSAVAQARKLTPDLILLDLGLPAGDGFSVLERLKANDSLSLIPVIVVFVTLKPRSIPRANCMARPNARPPPSRSTQSATWMPTSHDRRPSHDRRSSRR